MKKEVIKTIYVERLCFPADEDKAKYECKMDLINKISEFIDYESHPLENGPIEGCFLISATLRIIEFENIEDND